jgi:uncharacterized UPF0160 family protein
LVWQTFGPKYVRLAGLLPDIAPEMVADLVDRALIQAIDAHDNGAVEMQPGPFVPVSISQVFSHLNPVALPTPGDMTDVCLIAQRVLDTHVRHAVLGLVAEAKVARAWEDAPDKRVLLFDAYVDGWQTPVVAREEPLFVVFPNETGETWMVQAVPMAVGSFKSRQLLPEPWRAKPQPALAAMTVKDAVFCHSNGFIGGAKSKEGALEMARMALAYGA